MVIKSKQLSYSGNAGNKPIMHTAAQKSLQAYAFTGRKKPTKLAFLRGAFELKRVKKHERA